MLSRLHCGTLWSSRCKNHLLQLVWFLHFSHRQHLFNEDNSIYLQYTLQFISILLQPVASETNVFIFQDAETDTGSVDDELVSSPRSSYSPPAVTSTSIKRRPRSKVDQVLESISRKMDLPSSAETRKKEKHDTFGEYVAEKLRSLPPEMVCYCQKLINDAIFYAETRHLSANSRISLDRVTVNQPLLIHKNETLLHVNQPTNTVLEGNLEAAV